MKINFDAAFKESEHKSGSRIVIRDRKGRFLGSKVLINNNVPSSFAAEAIACVQSLQWGQHLGFPNVVVEGDSLSVIQKKKTKQV